MTNNPHLRGSLYAFLGIFFISFEALLVRLAHAPSPTILFWRGLFVGCSLTIFLSVRDKRSPFEILADCPRQYLTAALLFTLNGCGFVLSIANTTVANTVVILSTAPFFAALFSFLLNREQVKRHTLLAMVAMVVGTLVVVSSSFGTGRLLGDFLAILTASSVGLGQAYLRRHQSLQRISIVMVSGYLMALLTISFADLRPDISSLAVLAIMGMIQMPLAMVLFATATRFISAAETSMFMIVETVLGPLLVFIFLGEKVPLNTLYGGIIIIAALSINTWLSAKKTQINAPLAPSTD